MKIFKEHLNDDLTAVFFNENEFAEKANINRQEIIAIFSDIKEKKPRSGYEYGYTNHMENKKLLTLKKSDYELVGAPSQGERITVNEDSCEVLEINSYNGTVEIKVQVFI